MTARLYLDTADLLDIGDGHADAARAALVQAMADTGTVLLVSRDHIHDTVRETSDRLVRAVESFGDLATAVVLGPDEVEPLTAERVDIDVRPFESFRRMADNYRSKQREAIQTLDGVYDRVHSAAENAQRSIAALAKGEVASNQAYSLLAQVFVSLCLRKADEDPEALLSEWEGKLGTVPPHERSSVLASLAEVRTMVAALRPAIESENLDVAELLRMPLAWQGNPAAWPGQAMSLRVSSGKRRNFTRKPCKTDLLDHDHAKHFPYVDLATCDRTTLPIVQQAVREMKLPRTPVVLQSGHLDLVAAAVRAQHDE